jgi:hypothetical protein
MSNVFDASVNEKSTIESPNFLISILKSPTFIDQTIYSVSPKAVSR